ncbi:hypothetical protein [Exiguobacterium sp. AM39-5BH]|uniref:hypothetical protein n=1 Tax=Exiguobacterium sp. AM39-5BH TaxID=2292355 RepID=UPI000FE1E556|nr:hypothetical protein [Exiguobacterium sp. AM39-5BH]
MSKLIGSNLMEQSRLSAPFHNFEMFLKSPFFGNSIEVVFDNIDFVADTSTSSFALSVFGIFGVQYTLFWIYGLTKKSEILIADSIPVKFMILLVFLIILNKEPHLGILFSWCIMFYLV